MSEVAGAVTFLASRDAAFVNATDLKVGKSGDQISVVLMFAKIIIFHKNTL